MRPHPKVLIDRAVSLYGEGEVVEWAVSLLSGSTAPTDMDIALLGGSAEWPPYWRRVWGARALLYVWDDAAAQAVVGGLSDEHWRVREMCAKVCRHRELTEGSADLVKLAEDENERVRLSALKAIGAICEADAAGPLLAKSFRSGREAEAANASLRRMEHRLDRQLRVS